MRVLKRTSTRSYCVHAGKDSARTFCTTTSNRSPVDQRRGFEVRQAHKGGQRPVRLTWSASSASTSPGFGSGQVGGAPAQADAARINAYSRANTFGSTQARRHSAKPYYSRCCMMCCEPVSLADSIFLQQALCVHSNCEAFETHWPSTSWQ